MTIFQEIVSEEYLTVSEVKEYLQKIEKERAIDEDRELPYELSRTIEHVNRFTILGGKDSRELVNKLLELEKVNDKIACKIADLLPQSRDELRSIFVQDRQTVEGDELDAILSVVAEYI
tara:strand:- start:13767 stop:14123 length:357 start_codon:yes stop_codon:yes gene_type:complete